MQKPAFFPTVPPTFERAETEIVSQVAGRPLVLVCDVSGIPAPTVTWLKDRMPVGEYPCPACHSSANMSSLSAITVEGQDTASC